MRLLVFLVLFVSAAAAAAEAAKGESEPIKKRRLAQVEDLSSLEFDQLHRLAVLDQIDFHLRPQKSLETRRTKPLDGTYDFCLDHASPTSRGLAQKWHSKRLLSKCPPKDRYQMPVPSAFNEITSNSSVRNHMGWLWYQRVVPADELLHLSSPHQDHDWYLQFENANYLALVWVQQENGAEAKFLGSHVGGYLPFILPLPTGGYLQGESFRLTVAVSNILSSQTIPSGRMVDLSEQVGREFSKFEPDFDFFHFAGLMGSVNLIALNSKLHIQSVEVHFQEASASNDSSPLVMFEICLAGSSSMELSPKNLWIGTEIRRTDALNRESIESKETRLVGNCLELSFYANKLSRWSPAKGCPNHLADIYLASFKLRSGLELQRQDMFKLRFGLPSVAQERLLGVGSGPAGELPLQGFGMHMESPGGFSGRHMSPSAIQKDMYLLKQMGATLIRSSHYPYSTEYLDACDEHGILVIAECQAVGLNSFDLETKLALHKQLLKEMMQRDQHHVSILAWSVANEPQSQLEAAEPYFSQLLAFARRELAPYTTRASRPLTAAIAQSWKEDRVGHLLDLVMLNFYFGWYDYLGVIEAIRKPLLAALSGWNRLHPGKPLLISEFGAEAPGGQHSATGELFSEEYQSNLLMEHERVFQDLQNGGRRLLGNGSYDSINFRGSMIWNFADFSTHDSLQRFHGNQKGLFTRDRQPKAAASSVRQIYKQRLLDWPAAERHRCY